MIDYDFDRLKGLGWSDDFIEKMKDDPCWKGYQAVGMKTKNGRKVPNCTKVKSDSEHKEGDIATAEMTPNFLPKEPIPGGGDRENPQMGEHKQRMPRTPEIAKASNNNGHLAMQAAPNYAEDGDFSELLSDERNGRMIVNQLRVIREKTDTLLGMLDGSENLPPWCFVKITNAGTGLASVADYLKYGDEFV
jgi:hypothetical protein